VRVAIIPARGGSRRIPRKNIREFHGKPMLAYAIEAARAVRDFERIVVSTEDAEIASVAEAYGAEVLQRPPELAEIGAPDCGTHEVTRHALVALNVPADSLAVCIYPCVPLLLASDIAFVMQMAWHCVWPQFFCIPGQVYGGRAKAFIDRIPVEPHDAAAGTGMGVLGSEFGDKHYVDINTEEDFRRAEEMYAALHGAKA
jgi:CMP-N-acetylneuraminic acid synthetase